MLEMNSVEKKQQSQKKPLFFSKSTVLLIEKGPGKVTHDKTNKQKATKAIDRSQAVKAD